ncbi:hypothetical protein CJ026_025205 [Ralstonia pickettii]|nr:hypothetical protein [Ralstonia pickettii]MBA9888354.1 hypothetical protein [Ralstonia pickettii]MBA9893162.1 hypothetical protein [Ralstonia pickettii]MBA9925408.1 hypothetical protein [Ralstonia pickettii]MBB0178343.1 hypothetical protein [Ralstonia pickettii]
MRHRKSEVCRSGKPRIFVEQDIERPRLIQGREICSAQRRVGSMANTGSEKLMHLAELDFGYVLDEERVRDAAPAGELVHGCLSEHSER